MPRFDIYDDLPGRGRETARGLGPGQGRKYGFIALGILITLVLVIHVFASIGSTSNGSYGVVQNGGWADNKQVRTISAPDGTQVPQVLPQGSGIRWVGAWSSVYEYPASDRYWRTDIDGGADAQQAILVPTADGVNVGVAGTFRFQLNPDPEALGEFHQRFGIRPYSNGQGGTVYPWDGDEGWNAFLGQTIPGVAQNVLSSVLLTEPCAGLIPGCGVLKAGQTGVPVDPNAPADPAARVRVQNEVNRQFAATLAANNLVSSQGTPFFVNAFFTFERAELPKELADKVQAAKGAAADTVAAQQRALTAVADADRDRARQAGYGSCPACAEQDVIRAIPPNITVWAPGAGSSISVPAGR